MCGLVVAGMICIGVMSPPSTDRALTVGQLV